MVISLAFAGAPMVTSFAGPPMESDTAFAGGAPAGGGGAAPSSAGATAFTVLGLNSNDVADGLKLKLGASALSLGLGSSPSFAIGFFLSPPRSLCHRSKGFLGPFRRTAFVFAFVVSCELIRLGWQESGCPLSQPGLLCFKEVGCL